MREPPRARRIVQGTAAKVPGKPPLHTMGNRVLDERPFPAPTTPADLVMRDDIAQARQDILRAFAGVALEACAVIAHSLQTQVRKQRKERYSASAAVNARYVIDTIMDKAPAVRPMPVHTLLNCAPDELAQRREALVQATRELRKKDNE